MNVIFSVPGSALVALALAAGCASNVSSGPHRATAPSRTEAPALAAAPRPVPRPVAGVGAAGEAPVIDADARVVPGDRLTIRFPFHAELDQPDVVVRPDGAIAIPGFGELAVAGRSPAEIEEALAALTGERLRDPAPRVTIRAPQERVVYVAGEVGRPGRYVHVSRLTPLQAIAEAGGLLETARADSVILVRAEAGGESLEGRKLDLAALVESRTETIHLAPYDVLYVPKSSIANANVWVDQWVSKLFPFINGASARLPLPF